MNKSLGAVGIGLALTLGACSSGSSDTATSKPPSSATSHSTSPSPASTSSSQDAILAKLTALPGSGKGRVIDQAIQATGTKTLVTFDRDAAPTKLIGSDAATGAQRWSLDLAHPPKALTLATDEQASVIQIGDSILVRWTGTQGGDSLNTGTPTTVLALYGIDDGKLRGSAGYADPDYSPAKVSPYGAGSKLSDDSLSYQLPDGTQDRNSSINNIAMYEDGDDFSLDVDASTTARMTTPTSSGQATYTVVNPKTKAPKAAGKSCAAADNNMDPADMATSPGGQYLSWGGALMDVRTGKVTCPALGSNNVTKSIIGSDGALYSLANGNVVTLAWGASAPTVLPAGVTFPTAVLDNAAVYTVDNPDGSGNKATVVAPRTASAS